MAARSSRLAKTLSSYFISPPRSSLLSNTKNVALKFNYSANINFNGNLRDKTSMVRAMSSSSSSSSSPPPPPPTSPPIFGPKLLEMVKESTASSVVVYSRSSCSDCSEVIALLKKFGKEPFVIDLDEWGDQGPLLQKLLEKLTGRNEVPNVFIGGKHIGGLTETMKLKEKGELRQLLADADEANAKLIWN